MYAACSFAYLQKAQQQILRLVSKNDFGTCQKKELEKFLHCWQKFKKIYTLEIAVVLEGSEKQSILFQKM